MAIALAKPAKRSKLKYVHARANTSFSAPRVDIEFVEALSTEQVITEISQLSNPQIILWYIGSYGLKKAGVHFYRDYLISPILNQNENATFWLVDLTAWAAFRDPHCSIYNFSKCINKIEQFGDRQIKCIKSSDFFERIQSLNDQNLINYLKKSLRRNFISQTSKHFPDKNIRTKDIFTSNCALASDWYQYDTSKSYSVFQYLEGCWIIGEIFMQLSKKKDNSDIQIVLTLPNDENKYYNDGQNSLKKDITYLISKYCKKLNLKNISLKIKFLAFRYGSHSLDRPYNATGKTLKNSEISYEDVVARSKFVESIDQSVYTPVYS